MAYTINHPSVSQLSRIEYENFGTGGFFCNTRGLSCYCKESDASLQASFESLQADQLWVDVGCGEANALKEYVERYPSGGKAFGVTILRPRVPAREDEFIKTDKEIDRISIYLADFFDLPTEPIDNKVILITDIYAVFHYSGQLDRTLKKIYSLLQPGGKYFCSFAPQPYFGRITITDPEGNIVKVENSKKDMSEIIHSWMKTVKGFNILEFQGDIGDKNNVTVVLERTSESFAADFFETEDKNFTRPDSRSLLTRVSDCFRLRSFAPMQDYSWWNPSWSGKGIEADCNYRFVWKMNDSSLKPVIAT